MRATLRQVLLTLLLALCIFFAVQVTFEGCRVEGESMESSLFDGQRLLVIKANYWFGDPQRGDVIILESPQEPDKNLVKRVIATPGEWVEIKNGKVYITDTNGDTFALDEPYIIGNNQPYPRTKVPEGCYFVLGDNRNHSTDSRKFGMVPRENIIGEVWLCYWPLGDWHLINNPSYDQD